MKSVVSANKNTIVIINDPTKVNVPWLDQVKGVIFTGFPGAESRNGIADVLFGDFNPKWNIYLSLGLK